MLIKTITAFDPAFGQPIDMDLSPDGEWLGIFRVNGTLTIRSRDQFFTIPHPVRFPIIRRLDNRRILLADARAARDAMNAWILDDTGKELVSFHAGDAISDVLARDGRIVFTYFDEGILGRNALGQDAITVFDANGKYVGGYRSKLKDRAVPIHDCYAACWDGKDQIAFSAYNEFSLVRLNISTFEQIVFPTPIRLHGSSAISTSGPTASFYSPYDEENELFSWDISNRNGGISDLGQCNGRLRGLEGGRFILIDPISFTIVSANTIIKAGNES